MHPGAPGWEVGDRDDNPIPVKKTYGVKSQTVLHGCEEHSWGSRGSELGKKNKFWVLVEPLFKTIVIAPVNFTILIRMSFHL